MPREDNRATPWVAVVAALRTALDTIEALGGPVVQLPDDLGTIAKFAAEWQLEPKGLATAARRARVPTVKVGRQHAYRRSDLVALVDRMNNQREVRPATTSVAYRDIVSRAGRRSAA